MRKDSNLQLISKSIKALFITIIFVEGFLCNMAFANGSNHENGSSLISDDMLLEEFMYGQEWVTIASKRKQKREEVPSAVYVITSEDIKQSGVNRLADIFRMAPGMDVVTVDGNSSLVSIRGFAIDPLGVNGRSNLSEFSKRLLVMVDGRAIYNPAFGGVFWEQEPIFLEDIERVEIVRGPGAALYGANAVNGVINIITKDPENVEGGRAKGTFGSQDTLSGNITYGGSVGDFYYRITGGYREDDGYDDGLKVEKIDDFKDFKREPRVNFRGKYKFSDSANVEVFAGFMDGAEGEQFGGQVFFNTRDFKSVTTRDMTRAFAQFRFNKEFSETSDFHLQFFGNYTDIDEEDTRIGNLNADGGILLSPFEMDVRQYDVEMQHSFQLWSKDVVTWGVNYRNNQLWSRMSGSDEEFEKELANGGNSQKFKQEHNDIFGAFLQNDYNILDNLSLTIGVKGEHNSFTGTDISPRASIVYSPFKNHTFRASYSRAFRTPTFFEDAGFFNGRSNAGSDGMNIISLGNVGNEDLRPEKLDSYEIGYRGLFFDKLELNIETYFTRYKDLITLDGGLRNTSRADTNGFEVSIKYPIFPWLSVVTNYSFINFNARIADSPEERDSPDDTTPDQKANFGLRFKLDSGFSANLDLHYVDRIKVANEFIEEYLRVDLRLAQEFWDGKGEISITGQNLQEKRHAEFIDVEVQRAVFMSVGIKF